MADAPIDPSETTPLPARIPSLSEVHDAGADAERADAMPWDPTHQCSACKRPVDFLRARAVIALDTGFRYLCGRECLSKYRLSEPSRRMPALKPSAPHLGERGEELVQEVITPGPEIAPMPLPGWPPWLVSMSCAIGFWPNQTLRLLCAAVVVITLAIILRSSRLVRAEMGSNGLLVPAAGVVLLLCASIVLGDAWLMAAAGIGSALCWARELFAQRAQAPLHNLLRELERRIPPRTRLSLPDAQDAERYETRSSATQSVRAGEEVLVETGEVIAVDGVVAAGEGAVIPHPTAQTPVRRKVGDAVLAGARVVEGALRITATRVGSARALFRPPSFGQELVAGSASVVRATARARSPLLILLYVALSGIMAFAFAPNWPQGFAALGAALLAFPLLSLVLGVRLSFVAASALGASRGIVFRDAATLERAGRVGAAALAIDGVITQGHSTLMEVSPLGRDQEVNELTSLAMGAEVAAEEHPIAKAIMSYGYERGIAAATLRRVAYQRGHGVSALVEGGGALVLGNRQALLNAGVSVAVADREAQRAETQGRTVVFLAVGGRLRALFVLDDPVRPEARAAVQTLIDLDVEVVLLAGDHRTTVEALARPLDITHIKAELTGEERAQEVMRLRDTGVTVAVVGRAPQDELSLASGDIALTLDAAGGVHEGDIAVGSDDLRDAADAFVLAHRARRNVQGVLGAALGGGLSLAIAAVLGVLHPALVLAVSLAIDAWALPSPARLLRRRKRAFGATRSGVGWLRRA